MDVTKIVLSLGGNQGDVVETFHQAVDWLKDGGLNEINISSFYRTPPIGCKPGTPDFINGAVSGIWPSTLHELFHLCKNLEEKAGRHRNHLPYASRTLDLDIIFFGDLVYMSSELTIPHPEALNRLFVLIPLAEVAGDWIFPGKSIKVKKVLKPFEKQPGYMEIVGKKI